MMKVENESNYYAIFTPGETYPVNNEFMIAREGTDNFSENWKLVGIADRKTKSNIMNPKDALKITDWKYRDGNSKYTVVDIDYGSRRIWTGTSRSQQLLSFSKISKSQFDMLTGK